MNDDAYIEKIKTEIERSLARGRKLLWADFSIPKEKRDLILSNFKNIYRIEERVCVQCAGYDITIYAM